jgi:hypothetical protein
MDRAEAFTKLGQVTEQKQKLETELAGILAQEKELYEFLKIPQPGTEKPARRTRITKEKALDVRRKIVSVMKELCISKGLTWVPMQLVVSMVEQEMPNADSGEIERQLRTLATSQSAPVEHNGQRGNGSAYTFTGTPEPIAPPQAPQQ